MERISSIMLIRKGNGTLKFILGGSALAILKLEFEVATGTLSNKI
ncbi:UNVERIFIED_CONTAM: hypothetical protein NCL1_42943 [Trichonephila clavipes]